MAKENISDIHEDATSVELARKIKSADQVLQEVGEFPRNKKVIMCHGTFDIVHPGHLRQLVWARNHGNTLIVSLTADEFVSKRPEGPYVPHDLRALNVAAYQFVDHVVIDHNETPINNILRIKPDFFVKGFEYSLKGVHPRTKDEIEALHTYGGEMLFSPGDIVFSSSKILASERPNLSLERLSILMNREGVSFSDIKQTLEGMRNIKAVVVGDLIIDKLSQVEIKGMAQKSMALTSRRLSTTRFVGGAGVVSKHLRSLGVDVNFITVVGDDETAAFALANLLEAGVQVKAICDTSRPTTVKERFYHQGNQQAFQVNDIDPSPISEGVLSQVCSKLGAISAEVSVISDFRHGIFNTETIPAICNNLPRRSLRVADTQVATDKGNILDFMDFDLLTVNEREARYTLKDEHSGIVPIANRLFNESGCKFLILKLGKDGLMVHRRSDRDTRGFFPIDSFVHDPLDPIGAGDALLAGSSAALAVSGNIIHAAIIGNICAAIECTKMGNIPVTREDIFDKISGLEKAL